MIRTYVDGVLKGSKTDGTGNIAEVENLVLGNTNVNFVNAFGGYLDEISIYKGALTAEEVLENYNNGLKTGLFTPNAQSALHVSPNPFTDELNIELNGLQNGQATISFYSVAGQLILQKRMNASNGIIHLTGLDMLNQGVYFCTISAEQQKWSVKVIK